MGSKQTRRCAGLGIIQMAKNYWNWQLQNLPACSPRHCFHFNRKWRHRILPVRGKSQKYVYFGSLSAQYSLKTIQPISKRFTVLDRLIQVLHCLLRQTSDIVVTWPRKWDSNSGRRSLFFFQKTTDVWNYWQLQRQNLPTCSRPIHCLHFNRKWQHQELLVRRKSH